LARLAPLAPPAAYLLLATAWSWPLPLHLTTRFAHDPGDPLLNTFILWWNAHAVPLSRAMWNAPYYWPMRGALALTEHEAGIGLIASPIQWLGGSPLFAYNVLLIASAWWSGLAVHTLVQRLTASGAAAWCAGLIWAIAPYRASQLAHLQVLVAWWMPIALLALHGYYDDGRPRWLLLFGVAWLLQALSNGYYMFFFPVLVAGWIAAFTSWRTDWRRATRVLCTWAAFSLPLLPVLHEYYSVQRLLNLSRTRTEMQMFGATWASFVHYPPLLRFWPLSDAKTQEDFLFPGLAGLVAVASAVLLGRPRGALTRPFLFYIGAALVLGWLAAGPSSAQWSAGSLWHAYDWIDWLPGYNGLRVPARFFMLATLCLAIAAGIGVAAIATTRRRAVATASIVCALALVDGWILPMPLGTPPHALGTPLGSGAHVLELPLDDDGVNIAAMYRATMHGLPVVNGYAGYMPPHTAVIDWALRRGDPSVLTELRRGHALYVVVANHESAERWTAFMNAQIEARLVNVSSAGRLYVMPAAPFAQQVAVGAPIAIAHGENSGGWLTFDLGTARAVRAVELRTRGHFVLLGATVRVETSLDGISWALAADAPSGALALNGVLREPLAAPVRVSLADPSARFVRIDTPAFGVTAVTVFGP
jgi:hypothetical protein